MVPFSLPLFCVSLHCGFLSFVFIHTLHVNEVRAVRGSAVEVLTDQLWSPLPASLLSVVALVLWGPVFHYGEQGGESM